MGRCASRRYSTHNACREQTRPNYQIKPHRNTRKNMPGIPQGKITLPNHRELLRSSTPDPGSLVAIQAYRTAPHRAASRRTAPDRTTPRQQRAALHAPGRTTTVPLTLSRGRRARSRRSSTPRRTPPRSPLVERWSPPREKKLGWRKPARAKTKVVKKWSKGRRNTTVRTCDTRHPQSHSHPHAQPKPCTPT